jgi:hypothetical protein
LGRFHLNVILFRQFGSHTCRHAECCGGGSIKQFGQSIELLSPLATQSISTYPQNYPNLCMPENKKRAKSFKDLALVHVCIQ